MSYGHRQYLHDLTSDLGLPQWLGQGFVYGIVYFISLPFRSTTVRVSICFLPIVKEAYDPVTFKGGSHPRTNGSGPTVRSPRSATVSILLFGKIVKILIHEHECHDFTKNGQHLLKISNVC